MSRLLTTVATLTISGLVPLAAQADPAAFPEDRALENVRLIDDADNVADTRRRDTSDAGFPTPAARTPRPGVGSVGRNTSEEGFPYPAQ